VINWTNESGTWVCEEYKRSAKLQFLGSQWCLNINYFPRIYSDLHTWDVQVFWNERYSKTIDSALMLSGKILRQEWPSPILLN